MLDGNETTILTVAQYLYDVRGNRTKVIDAEGNWTNYKYDTADRLIEVDTPSGTETTRITTYYTYDVNGNRTSLRDAEGHITTYTYDELDRLKTVTDATGHRTEYTYDSLGNIQTMTDGKGQTTTYTYDAMNRLTNDGLVSYTYDMLGNRVTMSDAQGMTTYRYDKLSRLVETTIPIGTVLTYEYDNVGNRRNMKMSGIGESAGKTAQRAIRDSQ